MSLLLGIDIGTSSAKAILFEPAHRQIVAVAQQDYPLHKPTPDRAEQNPADWWHATVNLVRQLTAEADRRDIAAIGLSGQMHGTVLLDGQNQPHQPAIIWADQRSGSAVQRLVDSVGQARYAALTGTLPAVGFMAATLVWLADHQPAILEQTQRVILPKDYVRFRLTGNIATDISDAASTGLFDIHHRQWATEIIQAVGLPADILPPILDSTDLAGSLTHQAAEALGVSPGLPVVAGCADQPAQAIGNGLIQPGKASVTIGSGGQLFIPWQPTDGTTIPTDPRLHIFNHAVPSRWYILGAILSAGLSLRWLREITGLASDSTAYHRLSDEAATVPPGSEGLIFLPYLAGERTPHMDPLARGGFIGLTHFHHRGHLARAVMEGVTFALRQAFDLSLTLSGPVELLIAAGGGATSPVWRQIQADIFGLPLRQTLLTEQASVGAALLAGVGIGLFADVTSASEQVVRYGPLTEPDPANHTFYQQRYVHFQELYPRLRTDFHRLSRREFQS